MLGSALVGRIHSANEHWLSRDVVCVRPAIYLAGWAGATLWQERNMKRYFQSYRDDRFIPVNPTARPTSHQPTSAVGAA